MVGTISEVYLDLRNELRRHGVTSASLEAKELLAFALEIPRDQMNERSGSYLFDQQLTRLDQLKARRLSGEPLAYIIGEWDFYSITFQLNPNVLIPRPDTETLVDVGLAFFNRRERGRILDLCCGSGCVGVALLKNLPDTVSCVFADISEPALEIVKENLTRQRLNFRGLAVRQSAWEPCAEDLGKFNLIVCNPPYIPSGDIAGLDASVRDYEPRLALDGGADGLDFYRAISVNFKRALTKNGMLAFECGAGQSQALQQILEQAGYCEIRTMRDFSGAPIPAGKIRTFANR